MSDEDDNVVDHPAAVLATGIPVDFVMRSLELGENAPAARAQGDKILGWGSDGCTHEFHQVLVDLDRRTLTCSNCKGAVDPLAWIARVAKDWQRITGWARHARGEQHRAEAETARLKKEASKLKAAVQKHTDMLIAMGVEVPSQAAATRMARARFRR